MKGDKKRCRILREFNQIESMEETEQLKCKDIIRAIFKNQTK